MNKHYFKYDSGYINIDEENLYLTNSGNWQETKELKEKSSKTKKQNSSRQNWNNFFLFAVFTGIGVVVYMMFTRQNKSYKIIGGLLVLAVLVYKYFQPEMGNRYKIPLNKIDRIEIWEKGIRIHFKNEANETDKEDINNVDPKGFEILSKLNLLKTKALSS